MKVFSMKCSLSTDLQWFSPSKYSEFLVSGMCIDSLEWAWNAGTQHKVIFLEILFCQLCTRAGAWV